MNKKVKKINYKDIEIISCVETNDFANPRFSNNGGGYSQPLYTFKVFGEIGTFHNTSCGDFGDRWEVKIGRKKCVYDGMGREETYYTTFTQKDWWIANLIYQKFNIDILDYSLMD